MARVKESYRSLDDEMDKLGEDVVGVEKGIRSVGDAMPSKMDSLQRTTDDIGAWSRAAHLMNSQSYYGIEVTSDVYGFPVDQDERSGIFVQISNQGDGTQSSRNALNVGWQVWPGLYGDSNTHFYVYWTRDGYQKTGCYDLKCPGYVPEANVRTVPGVTIDAVSNPDGVKRTIVFKVFKDSSGDWLLHIGFDSEPYLIGRFPKSLFTSLGDKGDTIILAGFVSTHTTHLAPMGSGFLSNNIKAASFSNIQLIDDKGETSKVQQDHPVIIDDKNIYSVSPITVEGKFTYGGPLE
ncbi:protein neprosin-like [Phragmites australis]|uniref:protein neprosin-like n=1 Tax=Phragmites australis TaxID=29695 RepID=UPI002D7814D2|nr:protein neprosin-like [Phragmites australis]